jgi:hypothetical protein
VPAGEAAATPGSRQADRPARGEDVAREER